MSRYIDADALKRTYESYWRDLTYDQESISKSARLSLIMWVIDQLKEQPIADVVEVVRCKDCKWYDGNECLEQLGLVCARDEDFCSWGERRTE